MGRKSDLLQGGLRRDFFPLGRPGFHDRENGVLI